MPPDPSVCIEPGCGAVLEVRTADGRCPSCQIRRATSSKKKGTSIVAAATGAQFGAYELIDKIAAGGMGVVWKARHVTLHRVVALKMTLLGSFAGPEDVQRFLIEAEAAAGLDHPNIVPIYEVGEHEGQHFFSMKLIEGASLNDQVQRLGRRPHEIARIIALTAHALHYAHENGIIHRDLKPANILLGEDGTPYLTDFGLAKRVEGGQSLTETGYAIGTPAYMSPEQARGEKKLTTSTDIYSLGAVLYELLAGSSPFVAPTPGEVLRMVTEEEPPRPSSLNPAVDRDLETICLKCLQKTPVRRYRSAEALAEDLESWSRNEPIRARPISTYERVTKWARRRRLAAATALVCLFSFVVLVGGGFEFNRRLNVALARNEVSRRDLQRLLGRQVAERMDADFRRLGAVPQSLAAQFSKRTDWPEAALREVVIENLQADARLFGICVAFEPKAFDGVRNDYALYVYRTPQGPASMIFTPDVYQPLYREWAWYTEPRKAGRAIWSDPYFDKGGGGVWMTTYSVPFQRGAQFSGVVTADLSIPEYVKVLRSWLDELHLGEGAYGFVVDATGAIVTHPDRTWFRAKMVELAAKSGEPWFKELSRLTAAGKDGVIEGRDPRSGLPCSYIVSRVPSSGWTFVAVVPEQEP